MELTVKMLPGELWYGPSTKIGQLLPHDESTDFYTDIETGCSCNQDNPFLVSDMGRYIFAPKGFTLRIKDGTININSRFGEIFFREGFSNLREAFLDASGRYFPPNGKIPPEEFFTVPQYNTWIELIYDQNQADVLRYAHGIADSGMPAGVLMIDDGWNDYYGSFRFSKEKFPDPAAMCRELHELGFKVMMWVCPFVSPDSTEFRYLRDRGMLVRTPRMTGALSGTGESVSVREWWNGWSAVLDMTNPETEKWLDEKLRRLMDEYGVDGFKLDAGDAIYYFEDDITYAPVTPAEHSALWCRFGERFAFNEYRAAFGCAGEPIVMRLHDKSHSWETGVAALIPDTLAQSVMGYAYTCPDMIGGGSFADFLPGSTTFDPELLVRYCQVAALMPMMQFSVAPWRVLNEEDFETVMKMCRLHEKFAPKIIALAKEAAVTGEPVVRSLEYVFPHEGFGRTTDAFMLGSDVLVAPVYKKGERTRTLTLPEGIWSDDCDIVYLGGREITVEAPVGRLPYFTKLPDNKKVMRYLWEHGGKAEIKK